jgi:hypothetical protein
VVEDGLEDRRGGGVAHAKPKNLRRRAVQEGELAESESFETMR